MTILIIDDEEMITDITSKILGRAGYTVMTAESGQAGVDLFRRDAHEIDLVLLDLVLDDLPGVEVLRQIRRTKAGIPCIISSGQAPSPTDIPTELNSRLFFLQKPYRAEKLVQLVNEVLSDTASTKTPTE
ncbi:MAG: response regulator [Candidatus Zixiibacteriota bacterium]